MGMSKNLMINLYPEEVEEEEDFEVFFFLFNKKEGQDVKSCPKEEGKKERENESSYRK